jgi:hypothetical protein
MRFMSSFKGCHNSHSRLDNSMRPRFGVELAFDGIELGPLPGDPIEHARRYRV